MKWMLCSNGSSRCHRRRRSNDDDEQQFVVINNNNIDDTRHHSYYQHNTMIYTNMFSVVSFFMTLLFTIFNTNNNNIVNGFAFAPNFITKMIEEQTSIQPRGLLSIVDTTTTTTSNMNDRIDHNDDDDSSSSTLTLPKKEDQNKENDSIIIRTRFPPEPNGYLHLGHAKAITFNFEVARIFNGLCHMRLDDTNPSKETIEYVNSILEDVIWIQDGLSDTDHNVPWDGPVRKTSNYFQYIYECAIELIKSGDAYIDSLSAEEMKTYRGTLTQPGIDSPYRTRTVEENLQLFIDMKNGIYLDGTHILRAKIDMKSSNINMRDPTLYRIKHEIHPETGDDWCIYPMYDFSHPISDSIENITHSLCTLEFEDHRTFYDWTILKLYNLNKLHYISQQIEFSRLNIKYTILSKRKLIQLVTENKVTGWDDPRMPTLSGIRRRGISPIAIRTFCEQIGISKSDSNIDYQILEDCIRNTMDDTCPRILSVLEPLKVTITNYESVNDSETFIIDNHPKRKELGQRIISFSNSIYIERDDFFDVEGNDGMNNNGKVPKGYKRLYIGQKVRLRYAYVIECINVIRDTITNEPIELQCIYYPDTKSGVTPTGMERIQGIIHWVDQSSSISCIVNQYDRLFTTEEPGKISGDFLLDLNPNSLKQISNVQIESSVLNDVTTLLNTIEKHDEEKAHNNNGDDKKSLRKKIYPSSLSYQFERNGYYALDKDATSDNIIFNRVVTLRDTWGMKQNNHVETTTTTNQKTTTQQSSSNNETPIEDIRRIAFRVGTLLSVKQHPDSDNLIVCTVDCGDEDNTLRTVVAGLGKHMDMVQEYIDQKVVVVANLKPAKLVGIESTAMLLVASSSSSKNDNDDDEVMQNMDLLSVPSTIPNGELLHFDNMERNQPDQMLKSKGAVKVWDRVQKQLYTNELGQVIYKNDNANNDKKQQYPMICSTGGYVTTQKNIIHGTIQ